MTRRCQTSLRFQRKTLSTSVNGPGYIAAVRVVGSK